MARDLGLDEIAVGEMDRRSHARPHATGGAGEHDVAGTQDREGGV